MVVATAAHSIAAAMADTVAAFATMGSAVACIVAADSTVGWD